MLYNIENKNGYEVYSFKNIDLKIKCIEISDRVNVYINYNGCNPLFSMLFGGFEVECELSSIRFDIGYEKDGCNNTMYGVVSRLDAKEFIMEIYFFIMENRTAINLNEYDKNVWDY